MRLIALLFFLTGLLAEEWTTKATVTAYCPCVKCCGEWADGKTKSQTDAHTSGIATALNVYKVFRAKRISIKIPGYGTFIPDDIGGAMNQSAKAGKLHIDVRFRTHKEALEWGKKTLKVTLQKPSSDSS